MSTVVGSGLARVTQAAHGAHSALRRQPVLIDTALVVGLLVPSMVNQLGDMPTQPLARPFSAALILPLYLRRRRPLQVFALLALIAAGSWAADVRAFGVAALLVAMYTVAAERPLGETAVAFGVLEAGVVLAAVRWAPNASATVNGLVGLSGLAAAAAGMGLSTRSRRELVASLEDRAHRLELERDQQGRLSAAAERARIAREMHDIVAHNLSVMIALADGAGFAIDDDPDGARRAVKTASETGRQALDEMRRLLGVLREREAPTGGLSPQPGLYELEALIHQVRSAGLPVSFRTVGSHGPAEPSPGLQLAIYRIVQEGLTNTLKHAGPGVSASLTIAYGPESIDVELTDDGMAHGGPEVDPGGGLRGMRERASVYRGQLDVGPVLEGGWRVHLRVPRSDMAVS